MPITIDSRQKFADAIANFTDNSLALLTEHTIRQAIAHRITDPIHDCHWQSDACYLEAQRRERPDIYRDAYKRARRRPIAVKIALIIGALWILQGIFSTGVCNAYFQAKFHNGREDLGKCAVISINPTGFIIAPLMSGFMEYGWSLDPNYKETNS